MPVIAVAVAIGATAFAATEVVAGAFTLITALEVTAAVGATVSAVGAVTGNKALSMAGMAIGAIGAVGGLAAGAGLLGEGANAPLFGEQAAGAAADEAAAGTVDAISGVEQGTWDIPGAAVPDAATTGNVVANAADPAASLARNAAGVEQGAWDIPATAAAADPAAQLASTTGALGSPTGAELQDSQIFAATTANATDPAAAAQPTTTAASGTGEQGSWNLPSTSTAGAIDGGEQGVFGKLLAFAKDNPVLAYGAVQAGGSFLSGLKAPDPSQVAAQNAQAAANDAAAALTRQQTANLAQPKAVASLAPVTGTPAPLIPGFINQPRQPQVTGVPA